jgi:hypothetical protein
MTIPDLVHVTAAYLRDQGFAVTEQPTGLLIGLTSRVPSPMEVWVAADYTMAYEDLHRTRRGVWIDMRRYV